MIKGKCFAFEYDGDSFYPEYRPGDHIICTEIEDFNWLVKGRLYVFQTIHGIIIKEFVKIEKDLCYLAHQNKDVKLPDPLPLKSIKVIYHKEYLLRK